MRYVVLDRWGEWDVTEVAGRRGTVLGTFHTLESAQALALQRLAYGDRAVIIVDVVGGAVAYDPSATSADEPAPPSSGRRSSTDAQASDAPAAPRLRRPSGSR